MVFKASSVQRSASAVKNLWGGGSANQPVPSFFVSTPQFQRQHRQVGPYAGGARANSGKSQGLKIKCCPSIQYSSTSSILDEERYEKDRTKKAPFIPSRGKNSIAGLKETSDSYKGGSENENLTSEEVADLGNDATLVAFRAMEEAGQHDAVLNAFEELERKSDKDIPVGIYNCVMQSLSALGAAELQDATVVLEVYSRVLSRGVVPDLETYNIVINALVEAAERLSSKRKELERLLGPAKSLESADEAWETLCVEDHLKLAVEIFEASTSVDSTNFDHEVALRLFNSLVAHSMIAEARSLRHCVGSAQILVCESAEELQEIYDGNNPVDYIRTAFRLGKPELAMAEFANKGAPLELLDDILIGFASSGLLATALRWAEQGQATGIQLNKCLENATDDSDQVGSAVALFEKLVVDHPESVSNKSRCAFLRLARDDTDALMIGVKESHLAKALWDPATLIVVCESLVSFNEPLLAADIFVWQGRQLDEQWRALDVKSYAGAEILGRLVRAFQSQGSISLDVAAQLAQVPFVTEGFDSRTSIFKPIWEARSYSPGRLVLSDSELLALVCVQAKWVLDAETRLGLSLPVEEVKQLSAVFPLFVEDCISRNIPITTEEGANVGHALDLLDAEYALQRLWAERIASPNIEKQTTDIPEAVGYANTNNGIDLAVESLQRDLLRGVIPSTNDVSNIIESCAHQKVPMGPIIEMLEQRILPSDATWWIPVLDSIVEHVAQYDFSLAQQAHSKLLDLGSHPSATSYAQLIQYGTGNISSAVQLFNEARSHAVMPNTFLYNVVLAKLARARRDPELHMLWQEMDTLGVPKTSVTYGTMIAASCRAHDIESAHKFFREMESQDSYVPRVAPFNMLMQYYVHTAKDRDNALITFDRLRRSGCSPSVHTYRLLIEAWLLESPNLDKADNVLSIMKEDGAPFSTRCFAALLWARGVLLRDFDSAVSFYRGLVKNSRVKPDRRIFKALLETYVVNDRVKDTPLVLEEMSQYGVSVDKELLDVLIKGWHSIDVQAAERLQAL